MQDEPDLTMAQTHFLAGDWGTSRLRLTLFADDGRGPRSIETRHGPGVKDTEDFEAVFVALADSLWPGKDTISAYLAGMAGSNIGWRETAYAPCPVSADALMEHGVELNVRDKYRVFIAPGATCMNFFGCRDVMRGEETQIIGMLGDSAIGSGRRLLCLPGTHAKWALVENGALLRFETSLQGELFDVLSRHTILTKGAEPSSRPPAVTDAFERAVVLLRDQPQLTLSQSLFMTRSLCLFEELKKEEARDFLSGLTIAADARDVPPRFLEHDGIELPIILVGDPALTRLYARALQLCGYDAAEHDGAGAVARGLDIFRHKRKIRKGEHEAV